jgi:hypothetical protein
MRRYLLELMVALQLEALGMAADDQSLEPWV